RQPPRDHRRRQQRRRSRRLPAGPAGGARIRCPEPARRSRSDEGRDPRAVAPGRAADLGRAGVSLSVVADSVSRGSHRREAADHRARRAGGSRARVPGVPRAPSRRSRAARDRARRDAARARSGGQRGDRPRTEGGRLQVRQPRSPGLSHRQSERRAVPASHVNITHTEPAAPASRRRFVSVDSAAPFAVLLAAVFLAFHLPYLPQSLEDLDSINFALGVRHFDVAEHQPHPPGYPLFILAARTAHALIPSEASALAVVSIVAGTLGILAIAALFGRLAPDVPRAWIAAATALAVASPIYWFTAARPLSDMTGLAAAIGVQAMILGARTDRELMLASFSAALAAGIRSQVVWLTVPLLIVRVLVGFRRREALHHSVKIATAYGGGILAWFVPLVALTGGPSAYWRALFNQGAEDLTNIQMLWTRPTVRTLIDALYYALVAPWAVWPIAAVVLAFAAIGAVVLLRRNPRALGALAAAFGPYFVFDVVFQETFTSRYALPLVIPAAFLTAAGARS